MRSILFAIVLVAACGNGSGDDIDPPIDAFESTCGMPGDQGNELGIGKFCTMLGDCEGTVDAPLCAVLGDPMAFFCTKICSPPGDAGVNECGTNATCTCSGANCGCVPNSCLE